MGRQRQTPHGRRPLEAPPRRRPAGPAGGLQASERRCRISLTDVESEAGPTSPIQPSEQRCRGRFKAPRLVRRALLHRS